MYPGVNHGFHNDATPRFYEAAAKLEWQRTIDFFKEELAKQLLFSDKFDLEKNRLFFYFGQKGHNGKDC